jgi:hypothetical protein
MKMYLEAKNKKKSFEKTKHIILKNKTKPQMKVVNMFIIPFLALLNLNLLFHVIVCFLFIAFDFFGKILY